MSSILQQPSPFRAHGSRASACFPCHSPPAVMTSWYMCYYRACPTRVRSSWQASSGSSHPMLSNMRLMISIVMRGSTLPPRPPPALLPPTPVHVRGHLPPSSPKQLSHFIFDTSPFSQACRRDAALNVTVILGRPFPAAFPMGGIMCAVVHVSRARQPAAGHQGRQKKKPLHMHTHMLQHEQASRMSQSRHAEQMIA
ncbi:hypothetical protein EI94DRAFT_231214 [Lactarius quietus]|nr:hypothetical protein EI94DRAFT_231214 [Lactarius quietus]